MVGEVVEFMDVHPGGIYLDATLGLGGHSEEILRRIGPEGRLIGIDRDEEALMAARMRLKDDHRFASCKSRFSDMDAVAREFGLEGRLNGVLMDLGVSMFQLKGEGRGFSFNTDEPLDMRMDRAGERTAADIVNTYPERELERIIREYGEDYRARRIAKFIVERRVKTPFATCRELAETVYSALGRSGRTHPATRTFQALRIELNEELKELADALKRAVSILAPQGRLVVISYHSLEDRIVKHFFKEEGHRGLLQVLTKKPLTPSDAETGANPSARSAKLRAVEVIG